MSSQGIRTDRALGAVSESGRFLARVFARCGPLPAALTLSAPRRTSEEIFITNNNTPETGPHAAAHSQGTGVPERAAAHSPASGAPFIYDAAIQLKWNQKGSCTRAVPSSGWM